MILRRFVKHVSDQNWFAVGLDVCVVVFGVYLGIYIGDAATERSLQNEVDNALQISAEALKGDLAYLEVVIESHRLGEQVLAEQRLALDPEALDEAAFAQHVGNASRYTRTFFANRSAYQSLKDNGHLARIRDNDLIVMLTDLYDRQYVRIDMNSLTLEEAIERYFMDELHVYWDMDGERMIAPVYENIARLRNGVRKRQVHSAYYKRRLEEELKPEIQRALEAIKQYLEKRR